MNSQINWTVVINGRTALNGKTYGAHFHGECELCDAGLTPLDAVDAIVTSCQERNREMQIVEAVQITLVVEPCLQPS